MALSSTATRGPRLLDRMVGAGAELLGGWGLRRWLLGRSLPPSHETVQAPGCCQAVEIRLDRFGVPHIDAQQAADIYFGQGYCHARDRFWQMELNRRTARGELTELFGERALRLDRAMRCLGFRRAADEEAATLNDEARTCLHAYTAGVNAYLTNHRRPVEHALLRLHPEPWRVVDTLAFARYMGWSLSFHWEAKLIRWHLASAELGSRNAERQDALADFLGYSALRAPSSALGGGASNNWVVAAARSATGRPLLASDPHLRPRLPATWYVMHLHGPDCNVIGATMPGTIGVLIGHNDRVAWGITAGLADCQDLYVERRHPEQPLRFAVGDQWQDAVAFKEDFRIRGQRTPLVDEVIRTRHGPLLNGYLGVDRDAPPLAMRSTTDSGPCGTVPLLRLNQARDWPSFRAALAEWSFPVLNFVYADVDGTIAYKLAGQVPLRNDDVASGPVAGWNDDHEWRGNVPFDDMPEAVNPPQGFWATANNAPTVPCRHYLARDWMDNHRHRRIVQLLQARPRHTLEDCQAMQGDQVSLAAQEIARRLCQVLASTDHPELAYLANWDGRLAVDSVAASIYSVFRRELISAAFRELPAQLLNFVYGQGIDEFVTCSSGFFGQGSAFVKRLLEELSARESGKAVLAEAFRATIAWLRREHGGAASSWEWGRLHAVRFAHVLGHSPLLERLLRLSRGPFPIGGDGDTLAQAGVDPWHPYEAATFTVSYRQVFDVGDWDSGRFILPTGQSGHPGSAHYDDMLSAWLRGENRPLLFSEAAIARETAETIQLRGAGNQERPNTTM